jgi:hypothetical protein
MNMKHINHLPICECGSKDFAALDRSRNRVGRMEFHLTCQKCKQTIKVGKSTFALFNYLNNRKPSDEFLKIYDLG